MAEADVLVRDWKTNMGSILAFSVVLALVFHRVTTQDAVILLGVAGGWIGYAAKDGGK